MDLKLKQGPVFNQAKPKDVLNFLRTRKHKIFSVSPDSLRISVTGKEMYLQISGEKIDKYPVRSSFLLKLLKWYSFPSSALRRLNGETVASIMNDFLLAIKSNQVFVTVEDNDALTITSDRYTQLSDLTIIDHCQELGIHSISRDDFITRLYLQERVKTEPVVGDECGFGYNIFNSETGFSQVSVAHYILRYSCTNGAVIRLGEQEQRRHYGIPQEQLEQFLKERIDKAEKTRVMVIDALNHLPQQKGKMKFDSLKKDLTKIIGRTDINTFENQINDKSTAYDIFNLLTDHAKSLDLSRRIKLETLAGNLLSMTNPSNQ